MTTLLRPLRLAALAVGGMAILCGSPFLHAEAPAGLFLNARSEPGISESLRLKGSNARQQLLATLRSTNGALLDVTVRRNTQ